MAVVVDNFNDTTYTLVINSADKVSGANNQATFQVNWKDFLPAEYDRYKMVFTFQTTGGYYSDNVYSTTSTSTSATSASNDANKTGSIALNAGTAPAVGSYVVGLGVQSYTTVIASSTTSVTLSQPLALGIPSGTLFYYAATGTNVSFSSARIMMNTGSRSFSFDTGSKAQSTNLGVVTRDLQTSQTKSNTLSAFYCQNPPRVVQRPESNLLTVSIYNNSNGALLTDTTPVGFASDMTSWTMLIEFVPVADSRKTKHYEM